MGQFSTSSSSITLSPKMMTSNSPFEMSRLSMFRLGLLRALESRAQTPIMPMEDFLSAALLSLTADRSLAGLALLL